VDQQHLNHFIASTIFWKQCTKTTTSVWRGEDAT